MWCHINRRSIVSRLFCVHNCVKQHLSVLVDARFCVSSRAKVGQLCTNVLTCVHRVDEHIGRLYVAMQNAARVQKLHARRTIGAEANRQVPRQREELDYRLERAKRSALCYQAATILEKHSAAKLDNVFVTQLREKLCFVSQIGQLFVGKVLLTQQFDRNRLFSPSTTINNTSCT